MVLIQQACCGNNSLYTISLCLKNKTDKILLYNSILLSFFAINFVNSDVGLFKNELALEMTALTDFCSVK